MKIEEIEVGHEYAWNATRVKVLEMVRVKESIYGHRQVRKFRCELPDGMKSWNGHREIYPPGETIVISARDIHEEWGSFAERQARVRAAEELLNAAADGLRSALARAQIEAEPPRVSRGVIVLRLTPSGATGLAEAIGE